MRVAVAPVGTVLAVLALTGCGAVTDRADAAGDVAVRMLSAVAEKDGAGACALLAPDSAAEIEQSADQPCAEAILEEDLPAPGTVSASDVYGQWAQVRVGGDTVFLAVFPGGWRVVAAGCRSRGERPYDCAIQGG
ncbi:hypothetical protein [Micromonospora lupini]|uniref:hypothetical protein n=1 Tax=Micromonospora lupini TaxID=285679 RepID=UPI0031DA6543